MLFFQIKYKIFWYTNQSCLTRSYALFFHGGEGPTFPNEWWPLLDIPSHEDLSGRNLICLCWHLASGHITSIMTLDPSTRAGMRNCCSVCHCPVQSLRYKPHIKLLPVCPASMGLVGTTNSALTVCTMASCTTIASTSDGTDWFSSRSVIPT